MKGQVTSRQIYIVGFILLILLAIPIVIKEITPLGAADTRTLLLSNNVKVYLDSLNTVEKGSVNLKLDGEYRLKISGEKKGFKIVAYFRSISGKEGSNEGNPVYIDSYPKKEGMETGWVKEICIEKAEKAEVLNTCP